MKYLQNRYILMDIVLLFNEAVLNIFSSFISTMQTYLHES